MRNTSSWSIFRLPCLSPALYSICWRFGRAAGLWQGGILQPNWGGNYGAGGRSHRRACVAIATGGREASGKSALAFESGRLLGCADLDAHVVAHTPRARGQQQPGCRILGPRISRRPCRRANGPSGRHPERGSQHESVGHALRVHTSPDLELEKEVPRTVTVTILPASRRFTSIESTSASGASLTRSLTSPPLPRPIGALTRSTRRRLSVSASAIGLASCRRWRPWRPDGAGWPSCPR